MAMRWRRARSVPVHFLPTRRRRRNFRRDTDAGTKTVYPQPGSTLRAYLGIDSGSTTTKFVLLDENEELLDSFYAPNQGDPLTVAKKALIAMREKYASHGVRLEILAAGTTGYGEMLFSRAFSAETHAVETVAHARAAAKYTPDATFLLDIGGQDMKAIWLDNGVITNIVVNEACSSGCGSFWKILHPPCIFRRGRLLKRHFLRSIRLRSEAAVPSL